MHLSDLSLGGMVNTAGSRSDPWNIIAFTMLYSEHPSFVASPAVLPIHLHTMKLAGNTKG